MPFSYVERATLQLRPALVVSRDLGDPAASLFCAVMITSAANRPWPDDIPLVDDYAVYGLPHPSVIRFAKIASIATVDATLVGRLRGEKLARVDRALRVAMVLPSPV